METRLNIKQTKTEPDTMAVGFLNLLSMKASLFYILASIFLTTFYHTIHRQSQDFEGSIEFHLIRNGETSRIEKHFFNERYYGKRALFFALDIDLGDIILDLDNESRVSVKHTARTVENLGIEKRDGSEDKSEIIVTEEFTEIQGYKCRKYIHKKYSSEFHTTTTSWLWITEELTFKKLDRIAEITADKSTISALHSMSDGIPLRVDFFNEYGGNYSYLEAIYIDTNVNTNVFFNIPNEYNQVNR